MKVSVIGWVGSTSLLLPLGNNWDSDRRFQGNGNLLLGLELSTNASVSLKRGQHFLKQVGSLDQNQSPKFTGPSSSIVTGPRGRWFSVSTSPQKFLPFVISSLMGADKHSRAFFSSVNLPFLKKLIRDKCSRVFSVPISARISKIVLLGWCVLNICKLEGWSLVKKHKVWSPRDSLNSYANLKMLHMHMVFKPLVRSNSTNRLNEIARLNFTFLYECISKVWVLHGKAQERMCSLVISCLCIVSPNEKYSRLCKQPTNVSRRSLSSTCIKYLGH